jgi:hypothetical protein
MNTRDIKEIKINFNNKSWDPQKHNILLKYDPKSKMGFSVSIISVDSEPKITSLDEANEVLKKFKL